MRRTTGAGERVFRWPSCAARACWRWWAVAGRRGLAVLHPWRDHVNDVINMVSRSSAGARLGSVRHSAQMFTQFGFHSGHRGARMFTHFDAHWETHGGRRGVPRAWVMHSWKSAPSGFPVFWMMMSMNLTWPGAGASRCEAVVSLHDVTPSGCSRLSGT